MQGSLSALLCALGNDKIYHKIYTKKNDFSLKNGSQNVAKIDEKTMFKNSSFSATILEGFFIEFWPIFSSFSIADFEPNSASILI